MSPGPGQGRSIEWAGPARRALQRLPEKVATAAVEFIYGALAEDPWRVGRPLRLRLEGRHSAHRGDYRVIYRIDDERGVIVIEAIAHRADAYRRD
ncbi:MAG: type II toxin-antitoxin system RelE family toxin [Actinomycetota bacterium]